ncbi:MAG: HD domain-containing protein [Desulfurococcaceae archaeon]|jgi:7,8-dihydroneopterin 2',3'-cyclic phosphate phosphodiesterase|nr:HD domain-containing protein [Desulfurococcaceae archaeon]MCC6052864.1 HD domain-containing protein [Desulfurococcaceae archaeon]
MNWINEIKEAIKSYAEKIEDSTIKRLVLEILEKPELTYTATRPLISLEESPAAPRKHHYFTGGLLLHTLSVARTAAAIAQIIEEVYGVKVDKDVVLAATILHDIYKYYQYTRDDVYGGYKARDDWYLPHHYALVGELVMRKAPEKLIRVISEIHGEAPFTTIEGLIAHLADSLDAKLGEILQNTMLSKVKELELTCQLYRAVNELLAEKGPREIIPLLFENPGEFKERVTKTCSAMSNETRSLNTLDHSL